MTFVVDPEWRERLWRFRWEARVSFQVCSWRSLFFASNTAQAQVPFVEKWVDSVSGSDTNSGNQANPYRTITHAVNEVNSLIGGGTGKIYVRGRTSSGVTVTYNDSGSNPDPETFPLEPKKGVSIVGDTVGSETGAPVIIETTGSNVNLLELGSRSLSYTNTSTFQSLTFQGG